MNQLTFYDLIDKYNQGVEPLDNWTTADLVRMVEAIDEELQQRAPPYSTYVGVIIDDYS